MDLVLISDIFLVGVSTSKIFRNRSTYPLLPLNLAMAPKRKRTTVEKPKAKSIDVVPKPKRIEIDFSKPSPDRDLGLRIEEKEFWVSRHELAKTSPVFNAMLFGEFQEAKKDVVELKDKESEEILEMLHCIFDGKAIDLANFDSMVQLGDEYQIELLMQKCSDFVLESMKAAKDVEGKMKIFQIAIRCRYKKAVHQGIKELSKCKFNNLQPYFQQIPVEVRNAIALLMATFNSDHIFERISGLYATCVSCDGRRICGGVQYCYQCGYALCDKCYMFRGYSKMNCCEDHCTACHTCRKKFGSTEICCECIDAMIVPELEKIGL